MKVINREGASLDVSYDEIKQRIARLCDPDMLTRIDIDRVVIQTINGIYDGISTAELDDLSARICASLQSVHHLYDALAARILVSNIAKNVRKRLADAGFAATFSGKTAYAHAHAESTLDPAYVAFVARHAERLDALIRYDRDATHHTYFSLRTLERSYLMRIDGQCVETPQDMWMRVAIVVGTSFGFAAIDEVAEVYRAMSSGEYTHATPTLFNAGMCVQQCSSCYLLGTDDSLSGIFKTLSDCAQISKWAGGIGLHVSNVRAKGSRIASTNGSSDGIVPMLKVYNECARYCNQSGRRKGSIAVYLEPWHADVWEFVELRRNVGAETERTRDLFLALWVPDEFMRRLEADEDWFLMSPDVCPGLVDAFDETEGAPGGGFSALYNRYVAEGKFVRKVRARALWQHVLNCQLETGVPYVMFKDSVNRKCNQSNVGTIRSSNLCAEITEYSDASSYAVCNLASIAVNRFVVYPNPENPGEGGPRGVPPLIDHARLHAAAKQVTRNLNRVIDVNAYPTPESRTSNVALRPIGVGVQGLGDLYCMLGLPYDDPRAIALDAEIMETIYHGCIEASVETAAREGAYDRFEGSPASEGRLQFDLWGLGEDRLSGRYDWGELKARVKRDGLRNSLLTALMPTATTSQILGNCESFEPIQGNVFKRSTMAGEFVVVNRHLMDDLMARGLWTEDLRRRLLARDGSVQSLPEIPDDLKRVYRTIWEVPQRAVIDHAAARGPFVDQSQSMNLYLAAPSFVKLSSALLHAWRSGLKTGVYYLRSTAAVEAIKYGILPAAAAAATSSDAPPKSSDTKTGDGVCRLRRAGEDGSCEMCSA